MRNLLLAFFAVALPPFRDAATQPAFQFILDNQPTPKKRLPETMPGGIAAFDYDNDGLTDLFFTNGPMPGRLLHNLGKGKFEDVTAVSKISTNGWTFGVAAADYDNDGNVDLFVTGLLGGTLFHNRGNGTFEEAKFPPVNGWAIAAGWFDYDRDGHLDLFVVRYLNIPSNNQPVCHDPSGKLIIYCHPRYFAGTSNLLFHNKGDGTFEDVSTASGISKHVGKGMSLAFADYDNDGHPDVYVTNDTMPNFLFHNQGNGTFEEVALDSGAALLDHGRPVSSMGVDFRDYDNDGLPDLSITALQGETFPLFRNLGKGQFRDTTYSAKMGPLTVRSSGWSNTFADFDNDGWKDLFIAASHVTDNIAEFSSDTYNQRNLLLLNNQGKFEDAGPVFPGERAHRGAAIADFDGDGRLDVAVSALGERPQLWINSLPNNNHWLRLKLKGKKSNRDGIGAKVTIGKQVQEYFTSYGYASSSNAGVHFGLGEAGSVPLLEIRWPSGTVQALRNVKVNQVLVVLEP